MHSLVLVPPAVITARQSGWTLRPIVSAHSPSIPLVIRPDNDNRAHPWAVEMETYQYSIIDPLVAEICWRLNLLEKEGAEYVETGRIDMMAIEARTGFWNMREELTEWVANHARGDVLVQKTPDGWRLVATHQDDRLLLLRRVDRGREHKIKLIRTNSMRERAVSRWVSENLHGLWERERDQDGHMIYLVRDMAEAGLLKLRWSDPEEGAQ